MNENLCAGVGDGSEKAEAPTQPVSPRINIPEVTKDITDMDKSMEEPSSDHDQKDEVAEVEELENRGREAGCENVCHHQRERHRLLYATLHGRENLQRRHLAQLVRVSVDVVIHLHADGDENADCHCGHDEDMRCEGSKNQIPPEHAHRGG